MPGDKPLGWAGEGKRGWVRGDGGGGLVWDPKRGHRRGSVPGNVTC